MCQLCEAFNSMTCPHCGETLGTAQEEIATGPDAAVTIARIEANKEIELAKIQAEASRSMDRAIVEEATVEAEAEESAAETTAEAVVEAVEAMADAQVAEAEIAAEAETEIADQELPDEITASETGENGDEAPEKKTHILFKGW